MIHRLALPLLLAALLPGCAVLFDGDPDEAGNVSRLTVARHLELAEEEYRAGRLLALLERLEPLREIYGITPEERSRSETLMAGAVERLADPDSPDALGEAGLYHVYRMELPVRLRARAGVETADRMLRDGRRVSAFKMIRDVEKVLPNHTERVRAGDVLARAGLSLARDDSRYYLWRRYDKRGRAALEMLVLNYPSDPHCAEAYTELVRLYEKDGHLDEAIERSEDLLFYHSTSTFAVEAEARLPELRLQRLKRDSYDRTELLRAQSEIEDWIARHPGHELEEYAQGVRRTCLRRLATSDLILARYYKRIDEATGVRLHAERALAEANAAGSAGVAEDAQALLDTLPAPEPEN